ncbi:Vacuolar protein sorting protein 36 Vps36 [Nesidiocoris tenuis]|uniref:Vacuolar protein-sorting-associated protein 36 n=1 Tax=Nesidiocoris tenuis TaxID=355587 RepID=A0ABN7AP77_9HEMI|nr:Vacuolar protein sorting protein 36 Vps36 [Nesidiocoris tenuis]
MNRFEHAFPYLLEGEERMGRAKNVRLYNGETKTSYEGGDVLLTSHRIIWGAPGAIENCDACLALSLAYIVFLEVEAPGAFVFTRSTKIVLHLAPPMTGKAPGPTPISAANLVKLSFKDGLEDLFLSELRNAVKLKKWNTVQPDLKPLPNKVLPVIKTRAGIVGIERNLEEKQRATDHSISAAFQDLSKLIDMAKDMVSLSKTISTKIREKQGEITDDETIQFKSYLLSLGIDDPVTRVSYSSESKYMMNLALQVAEILEIPVQEQGGMMSLADAYCRVNRARGLELLSPEDHLRACRTLNSLPSTNLRLREFDSGVRVLQLSSHSDEAVIEDTVQQMERNGTLSPEELSQKLGVSLLLARERLITTEKAGKICRDESIEGHRFYPNLFLQRE